MITLKEQNDMISEIEVSIKKLFFTSAIPDMCREAGTPKQIEFLKDALLAELNKRDENRRIRLVKRARFPVYKTFEGYDYHYVQLPPAFSKEELEAVSFIENKQNLVMYGPVGVGKTHMAIAAGVQACMLGYKTRFYTVTELVLKLAEARKNGTLERFRNDLNNQDLLILDEWGYVPVDRDGSELLFQIISDSYESKSLILTTNLEFSKWGGIFTDEQMAAAMIDRLVHHGHLLMFSGKSYRMEHALMRQVFTPAYCWEFTKLKVGNFYADFWYLVLLIYNFFGKKLSSLFFHEKRDITALGKQYLFLIIIHLSSIKSTN